MAEFVMKHIVSEAGLKECFHIFSRATRYDQIGKDTYPPAQRKLDEKGIPHQLRAAMRFSEEDYRKSRFIIAMDRHNIRDLKMISKDDPEKKIHLLMEYTGRSADVADPWYTQDFERTYQDIGSGCHAMLKSILSMKIL